MFVDAAFAFVVDGGTYADDYCEQSGNLEGSS